MPAAGVAPQGWLAQSPGCIRAPPAAVVLGEGGMQRWPSILGQQPAAPCPRLAAGLILVNWWQETAKVKAMNRLPAGPSCGSMRLL